MPNPDFTPYVDLTLYDKDPQDLFDAAVLQMGITIPEWEAREGQTEVVLLEGMAFEIAEAVFAINRLPNAIMQIVLQLIGVYRDVGEQPTAQLTFSVTDTLGHTVPANTQVLLNLQEGVNPVVFTTTQDLVILPGSATGTVTAVGDQYTQNANGVAAGTQVTLMDSITFVNSVVLGADISDGRDAEDDLAWVQRGVQRFQQLSDALVLPRQFQAHVLENTVVSRAKALDNYDPGSGHAVGADPGHLTVAVYGDNTLVSAPDKASILSDLQSRAQANLSIHIIDATLDTVNVTTSVVAEDNTNPTLVQANVVAAVRAYLSTATWDWSSSVKRNALLKVIGGASGVAYVDTLTVPSGDFALSGVAPLAVAGTVNVTVE